MIREYIELAEKFSLALQMEAILEKRNVDDSQLEDHVAKLMAMQRARRRLRNELDAITKDVCTEVIKRGGDALPVQRNTRAAWHYIHKYQDVWFETRSVLELLLITPAKNAADSNAKAYHPIFTFAKNLVGRSVKELNRPEIARAYIASLPGSDLAKMREIYPGRLLETHFVDLLRNHLEQWNP